MATTDARCWDIFCTVIDNHGDLGVCWRLSRQLLAAGQRVRLWVDDTSALAWMAPEAAQLSGLRLLSWAQASQPNCLADLPRAAVWLEAFGCDIPAAFLAHGVDQTGVGAPPLWVNLEYLSAEDWVARHHGLPSPVMSGPARGWQKRFFYPGFTSDTGGLLREADLQRRQAAFDRSTWRNTHAPAMAPQARLISLFGYEPPALANLLHRLAGGPDHLLVTPGRPLAALQQALRHWPADHPEPNWNALPYVDQLGFDQMLWACDLNLVRGEDSLVRALWAGRPFVWHIYPQDDLAHHAKLAAFLSWLQAPPSLWHFHRVWNGIEGGDLPNLDPSTLADWTACAQAARQRLLTQPDLLSQLMAWAQRTGAH